MKLGLGLMLVALVCATGCGQEIRPEYPAPRGGTFAKAHGRSPLPTGEHFLSSPSEDTAILGRILLAAYDPAKPLADQLAPNPCGEHLVDVSPRPLETHVLEDATSQSSESNAPTRVWYRINVRQRQEKATTKAYAACCLEHACGVGYVRGLTLGEGEVALAKPTAPGGNADVAFDDVPEPEPLELTLFDRRPVRGVVAFALEGPTAPAPYVVPTSPTDSAYEKAKIEVRESTKNPDLFELCTKSACMTENEFVRRYAKQTGAHELDQVNRDRSADVRYPAAIVAAGGVLLATLGGITAGLASNEEERKARDTQLVSGSFLIGIGLGTALFGTVFLILPPDGGTHQHFLSKSQAKRFVERYNRSLRETSEKHAAPNAGGTRG